MKYRGVRRIGDREKTGAVSGCALPRRGWIVVGMSGTVVVSGFTGEAL